MSLSPDRRLALWVVVGLVAAILLYLLRGALMPFLLGMSIAYLLDPLADRLERIGVPRGLAAALIIVAFFVIAAAALVIIVPALQAQITSLVSALPEYLTYLENAIKPVIRRLRTQLSPDQFERLRGMVSGQAGELVNKLGGLVAGLVSGGLAIVSFLSLLLITPVVAFYLLRDWDDIVKRIDDLLPRASAATIREQVHEIDRRLSGFVRGQAMVCLALGTFYAVGLTVIGLNYGLLIGMIAGVISFIPYFGTAVGLAASMGVAFSQYSDWVSIAIVAGVFIVGQILEGNVAQPILIGDRVGLHPVWIMFAVIAGGSILGFTGVLIAVPAAAVLGVLVRFVISRYQTSALYAPHGAATPPPVAEPVATDQDKRPA